MHYLMKLTKFCLVTGLKINYNKMLIMRLGSLRESEAKLITQSMISWSCRVKILGLYFIPDSNDMLTLNYGNLVSKIKKIIESWHNRDLTIMGKITIVNTLVVSQMVYCFLNTYSPNVNYTNMLEKLIKKYLWHDKPSVGYFGITQGNKRVSKSSNRTNTLQYSKSIK